MRAHALLPIEHRLSKAAVSLPYPRLGTLPCGWDIYSASACYRSAGAEFHSVELSSDLEVELLRIVQQLLGFLNSAKSQNTPTQTSLVRLPLVMYIFAFL